MKDVIEVLAEQRAEQLAAEKIKAAEDRVAAAEDKAARLQAELDRLKAAKGQD